MIKMRKSNFELLRILAMFLVLVVHADFGALGAPKIEEFQSNFWNCSFRYLIEAHAIVCVNVFVLLSGWFGIKSEGRKLVSLIFQILFFSLLFFLCFIFISPNSALSKEGIKSIFLFNKSDYWFVKAYLLLFVISPILNAFVDHVSEKEFRLFLIVFYIIEIIYGWLEDASIQFQLNGTTALSFIGLYMLARYIHLYPPKFAKLKKEYDLSIYIGISLFITAISIFLLSRGIYVGLSSRLYAYSSPLIIISALFLLLFFSKLKISSNKVINWIAASCFAVYLFHANKFFFHDLYFQTIQNLYNQYLWYGFLPLILGFLIIIYAISIMLDKIRLYFWKKIS